MGKVNVMAVEEQAYQNSIIEDGRRRRPWWLTIPVLATVTSVLTIAFVEVGMIVSPFPQMDAGIIILFSSLIFIPMLCGSVILSVYFACRRSFYPQLAPYQHIIYLVCAAALYFFGDGFQEPALWFVSQWVLLATVPLHVASIILWLVLAKTDSVKRIFSRDWQGRERRGTEV